MSKRTLVTSALPYANGPIHLGHLAGAYLPADFFVRYRRLRGDDIIFICGSDEHGVPITIAAEKEGVSPQDIVDRFHSINKKVFNDFGISFDYYGRTSSPVHHKTSQDFFLNLYEKGIFKKKTEKQLYDEKADMFLPDRYVKGICPVCSYEEAYGDQCEKCGSSLSPTELIDPISAITGEKPILKETEHWYLPLGDFQDTLEKWIDTRENWKPNVVGQCKSWLDNGLSDRAVTRDLKWGVPVPLKEAKGKVLYVWFDAPIGYISATKEWAAEKGNPDLWKTYWTDKETELIHFIGKDNIVFHCIMFPAMLMAHGDFVTPTNVPANEFLNLEGKKLSTSRGWAVWLHEYLEDFEPDLMRYVLGTTLPETKDSDFSWKDFQARVNNELADILGNFVYRTFSFISRFFDSRIPELNDPSDEDQAVLDQISEFKDKISDLYERFRFREAIAETMNLARLGNKYFTEQEPWHSRKNDMRKCGNTLHVCAQVATALSVLFDPIIPNKTSKLREYLNLEEIPEWNELNGDLLKAGHDIQSGDILFVKLEDEVIDQQLEKLKNRVAENTGDESDIPEPKSNIDYELFSQMDLRVGEVLEAEKIKKSNKLLKLLVDVGFEKRTIVSGISKYFKPDELLGRKVCVIVNLEPRKLMGIESKGMILMAEEADGTLFMLSSDAKNGSPIS
ncbi:MAG TPA: methionine--tRNA ligase [Balneolales bacterium]|nr:methionine--tRNA ligase [Balneolales bacterium]